MTDSDSGTLSEDIATKFLLPERQAKVNQLLKKMDSPHGDGADRQAGDEIYCICRSSDCSRFMIGCDRCNEWYHGDCINITQEESAHIKHFFCHLCRGKDPNLKIKYKHKKKKDKDKERSHKDKFKKHHLEKRFNKHRDHDPRRKHFEKSKHPEKSKHSDRSHDAIKKHKEATERNREMMEKQRREREAEKAREANKPPEEVKPAPPEPEPEISVDSPKEPDVSVDMNDSDGPVDMEVDEAAEGKDKIKQMLSEMLPSHTMLSRSAAAKKSARRCGQCVSCHKTEDCGRCDFCKDMKKFGGPNKIRQKCRLRQCLNFGLLKTQVQKMKALAEGSHGNMDSSSMCTDTSPCRPASGTAPSPLGTPTGTEPSPLRLSSAVDLTNTEASENDDFDQTETYTRRPKIPKGDRKSDSDFSTPGRKKTKDKNKKSEKRQKKAPQKESGRGRSKRLAEEDLEDALLKVEDDKSPRQCQGPGCIEVAREGSKYCSDDCGMKLATNRIFEILPQRIQQWQRTTCVAEEKNKFCLENIRHQQLEARQKLVELDRKHQELDSLMSMAKLIPAAEEQENADAEDEGEFTIHCVTCGHEVAQRTAVRHMERCFTKFESQTSFGSIYKTKIEGNSMFCDFYNVQNQTYCKRLKVLCPEHSKEPKVSADDVCGCPIMSNDFKDTQELCRIQKRRCNKHHGWEKLRRAEIDMERVRQWMKLDDLFEQERNIRVAMSSRSGVLGLMLHQTMDHDPRNPIKSKN